MIASRSAFKILRVKPTGKRPLGWPRRRWEVNIRTDINEIGVSTRGWVDSVREYGLLGSPCECGIEPRVSISLGIS